MARYSQDYEPLGAGLVRIPDDRLDKRSDSDIIECILKPPPVKGEKNIWGFWDRGFTAMHPWLQRNVIGWVRRSSAAGWTVRIVDLVPGSASHVHKFVDAKYLPDALNQGKLEDSCRGQQASDMTRLPLLYLHGGVYCDTGSYMLRTFDDVFWAEIDDPKSPIEFGGFSWAFYGHPAHCLNAFIACKKGSIFVEKWMTLFLEIWKGRTSAKDLRLHEKLKGVPPMPGNSDFEAKLDYDKIADYYAQGGCFEAVRMSKDEKTGWDGLKYMRQHAHCVGAFPETLRFTMGIALKELGGVDSPEQARLLALPCLPELRDADRDQATVYRLLNDLLANSSLNKLSSGWWEEGMPKPLAKIWGEEGHRDDDIRPGSWAEYLRYASEHFEQTRYQGQYLPRLEFSDEP